MKRHTKVTSEQQQQTEAHSVQKEEQSAREFASAEEMLRYDAMQTPVPPSIAGRLRESIGPVPPPTRSWWRRLFGSSS